MTDRTPTTEPQTEAAKKLMLLLAQAKIAWPDEYTFILISALTPMFAAIEDEARAPLVAALRDAVGLLDEVYGHTDTDGQAMEGPKVKIWVPRATIDSMGDRIAPLRDIRAALSHEDRP
jgi:hypothetical protein